LPWHGAQHSVFGLVRRRLQRLVPPVRRTDEDITGTRVYDDYAQQRRAEDSDAAADMRALYLHAAPRNVLESARREQAAAGGAAGMVREVLDRRDVLLLDLGHMVPAVRGQVVAVDVAYTSGGTHAGVDLYMLLGRDAVAHMWQLLQPRGSFLQTAPAPPPSWQQVIAKVNQLTRELRHATDSLTDTSAGYQDHAIVPVLPLLHYDDAPVSAVRRCMQLVFAPPAPATITVPCVSPSASTTATEDWRACTASTPLQGTNADVCAAHVLRLAQKGFVLHADVRFVVAVTRLGPLARNDLREPDSCSVTVKLTGRDVDVGELQPVTD